MLENCFFAMPWLEALWHQCLAISQKKAGAERMIQQWDCSDSWSICSWGKGPKYRSLQLIGDGRGGTHKHVSLNQLINSFRAVSLLQFRIFQIPCSGCIWRTATSCAESWRRLAWCPAPVFFCEYECACAAWGWIPYPALRGHLICWEAKQQWRTLLESVTPRWPVCINSFKCHILPLVKQKWHDISLVILLRMVMEWAK